MLQDNLSYGEEELAGVSESEPLPPPPAQQLPPHNGQISPQSFKPILFLL